MYCDTDCKRDAEFFFSKTMALKDNEFTVILIVDVTNNVIPVIICLCCSYLLLYAPSDVIKDVHILFIHAA